MREASTQDRKEAGRTSLLMHDKQARLTRGLRGRGARVQLLLRHDAVDVYPHTVRRSVKCSKCGPNVSGIKAEPGGSKGSGLAWCQREPAQHTHTRRQTKKNIYISKHMCMYTPMDTDMHTRHHTHAPLRMLVKASST